MPAVESVMITFLVSPCVGESKKPVNNVPSRKQDPALPENRCRSE